MKRFLLGLFLGVSLSICGFYVATVFIPQRMGDISQASSNNDSPEDSLVVKQKPSPAPVQVKKVLINGCAVKDGECTCYTKSGEQLNPSLSVCEKYIKSSGGAQFIFLGSPTSEDEYLRDLLNNAVSDNRSPRQW